MSSVADFLSQNAGIALGIGGLLLGLVFGAVVQRTNFCTMGAVSDSILLGDMRRLRAWGLAIAVAIAGTHVAALSGFVPLDKAMYLAPTLNWLGHIAGGVIFGFGMALAGGCPSRNLVRAGSGDLRSLIVLVVVGITGFATLGGVLGPARAWLEQSTQVALARFGSPTQGLGDVVATGIGMQRATVTAAVAFVIVVALLIACFADRSFRQSRTNIVAGLVIGILVVLGWLLTGLAYDEFSSRPQAPISLTFVRPAGDTLDWLQRATALGLPSFGVTSLIGAILGATVAAWGSGTLRLATFASKQDTLMSLGGAALMGIGGVLALGCSVGQGITGVSTLAIGSLLSLGAILIGTAAGIRALERWAA